MPNISQIVDVLISRDTRAPTAVGFGIPMVLSTFSTFVDRARTYEDADDMISDGFTTSDPEFLAISALFSQDIRPARAVLGRRIAEVAKVMQIDVTTVANTTLYRAIINGVNHDYTSDGSATALEIRDGLILAINGGSEPVTAAIVDADSLSVTADVAGDNFVMTVTANLTASTTTANHNIADDVTDVRAVNDDWYMMFSTDRGKRDILYLAAYIEGQKKMFIGCNDDADVKNAVALNVLAVLNGAGYDRTAYVFSEDEATYPEMRWAGGILPLNPGSETWKFKSASGSTPDNLSATQQTNIKSIKGNTYETFAGVDIMAEGTVVGGEFIDIIRGTDWLEIRMQERIFQTLVSNPKVPYTDLGGSILENDIRAQLKQGVTVGLLAASPEFTVIVPKVADIAPVDRAARLFPDITFSATYAGAIHKTTIRGRISI